MKCEMCGVAVPLSRFYCSANGGDNSIGNILPACATCNRKKGVKSVDEFRKALAS